jgi:hypothetical protein
LSIIKESYNFLGGTIIKKLIFVICIFVVAPLLFANTGSVDIEVGFHGFSWGTSLEEFTASVGAPVLTDEVNGLKSLVYDDLIMFGYQAFMVVYFSQNGLEGGTYYFNTFTLDELMKCYLDVQRAMIERFGPTLLADGIIREMRPYETAWDLTNGYVYLNVNTRNNEPVTLWFSSPYLTRMLMGS